MASDPPPVRIGFSPFQRTSFMDGPNAQSQMVNTALQLGTECEEQTNSLHLLPTNCLLWSSIKPTNKQEGGKHVIMCASIIN